MLQRLAKAGIALMTKHPTKQTVDFNPESLKAIRAHLRLSGLGTKEATFALIARLALRSWVDVLEAGGKIEVRKVRADIEQRYAATDIVSKQIGVVTEEILELTTAVFEALNKHELLEPHLTNNRHKTPNRRLIIYLAVEYYARAIAPNR